MADLLRFRRVDTKEYEEASARVDDVESPAGEFLIARAVWLDAVTPSGLELSQHRPVSGEWRQEGYARLDNEVLAGRRLHDLAGWSGYPAELVRLYGDESNSGDPFALFEPDRGDPLREVGKYLYGDEFDQFLVGLLTGLCWLAGAGIAHRAINPDTVRWDSDRGQVQIADFSRSAPFGSIRTPIAGSWSWVPRESRLDTCDGLVGPGDDTWAAARLLYFVRSGGTNLEDIGKLAEHGLSQIFNGMLEKVFAPPESRPTARNLVEHGLRRPHLLPSLRDDAGKRMIRGRESFLEMRTRAHPDATVPQDFWNDVSWARGAGQAGDPGGGSR